MALDVVVKSEGEVPVVALKGRIVDVDVKKIQHQLDRLQKELDHECIALDVTNTDFIDSHGLGVIVYFHTLMQKDKRRFVIVNANPDPNSYLSRLFELTNLDQVLNIVEKL